MQKLILVFCLFLIPGCNMLEVIRTVNNSKVTPRSEYCCDKGGNDVYSFRHRRNDCRYK